MANIVSLSGGKDSTAMLHHLLDHGEPIHSVVFFDTGWEFPAMYAHLIQVEKKTGIKIVRLKPAKSFDYWMFDHQVRWGSGLQKGQIRRIGCGWPLWTMRWCTREKMHALAVYAHRHPQATVCVGMAADERGRMKPGFRYPLIEWGMTSAACLRHCYDLGYWWAGLYSMFSRVSCYCCPFQRVGDLRMLRARFPRLWADIRQRGRRLAKADMDGRFSREKTVEEREAQFAAADHRALAEIKFPIATEDQNL